MNLAVFIESYLLDRFQISGTKLVSKINNEGICTFDPSKIHFAKDFSFVHFYDVPKPKDVNCVILDPAQNASVVFIALHYYYSFSESDCALYLKLRNERNGSVAHQGRETSMTTNELKDVFEKIITVIIDKDKAYSLHSQGVTQFNNCKVSG